MAKDLSDFGLPHPSGSGYLKFHDSAGAASKPVTRSLETHEASFAIEYLRSVCLGVIPNSLRPRVGESDLVQDVLLKATQSIGQFRGTTVDSFGCWLREIYQNRLKNLVRDHISSRKRSVHREEKLFVDSVVDEGANANQLLVEETTALELQIMNQTFQQLAPQDQQIVELHSRRGLAFDEVSRMLGASEVSVRKRYTRAIQRWRKLVQKASRNRL